MENERPIKPNSARFFPFFLSQRKISGRKKVFLIFSGILTIGFVLAGFIALRPHKSTFDYSSFDIVYGEKVIAIHSMSSINALNPVNQTKSDPSKDPSIQVSESFYDFGSVRSDQVLTHTFIIANKGASPLVIQQAFTTCGCTLAEISTDKIPPGKVALLTLQFDPSFHNMKGTTVRRGVIISTNDPNHQTYEIWVQASVK